MVEIDALQNLGCFRVAPADEEKHHRIYRARFVDYVKANGTKRSHLCAAA